MKKKFLLLVLFLLVCSSAAVVITYSNATVVSPTAIKIVSTNEAILALEPGDPQAYANYCYVAGDGTLYLNFAGPGFPPDCIFEWDALFHVTNNSSDQIRFSIENVAEAIPYISIKPMGGASYFIKDGVNQVYAHPLLPGESAALAVSFAIPENPVQGYIAGSLRLTTESAAP